jgi:hypothetical protein
LTKILNPITQKILADTADKSWNMPSEYVRLREGFEIVKSDFFETFGLVG